MTRDIQDRELMMYQYKMNSLKHGHKQHLAGLSGMTLCRAENGSSRLDLLSEDRDESRPVCKICQSLADRGFLEPRGRSKKSGSFEWEDHEIEAAVLIHGPDSTHSDTYRLHLEDEGRMLDVPGWMVGDPATAAMKLRAANIILRRLEREYNERQANLKVR